jgi:septal ring factor EnvC (AmiA/AmiB activator)
MGYLELQSHTPDIIYWCSLHIATMPPKQTSKVWKANLLKAREILELPAAPSDIANDLAISQKNLASAKTQITSLEHAVESSEATCAQLSRDLDAAKLKIADLN